MHEKFQNSRVIAKILLCMSQLLLRLSSIQKQLLIAIMTNLNLILEHFVVFLVFHKCLYCQHNYSYTSMHLLHFMYMFQAVHLYSRPALVGGLHITVLLIIVAISVHCSIGPLLFQGCSCCMCPPVTIFTRFCATQSVLQHKILEALNTCNLYIIFK